MKKMLNRLHSFPSEGREKTSPILGSVKFAVSLLCKRVKKKGEKRKQQQKKKRAEKEKHLLHYNEVKLSSHTNGGADNNIWL